MTDFLKGSIEDYLDVAASNAPTPGGGSVSALTAALAAAMASMAGNFTSGKKKFAAVEPEVNDLLEILSTTRRRLADLAQKDTEAYGAVSEAFKLPRSDQAEKAARKTAIASACRNAMAVPLEAVRSCREALVATSRMADLANPNLITDVGVAAILLEASARAAALNVRINLPSINDQEAATQVKAELQKTLAECAELAGDTANKVNAALE